MNNIWKRSLSLMLALVMVLGMLPMGVLADELETEGASEPTETVYVEESVPGETEAPVTAETEPEVPETTEEETEEAPEETQEATEEVPEETEAVVEEISEEIVGEAMAEDARDFDGAVGNVWLDKDKANADPEIPALGYPFYLINLGANLKSLVLEAVGYTETSSTMVKYGEYNIANTSEMQDSGVTDAVYKAISNHQTVCFDIYEGDTFIKKVGIAFRNILIADINSTTATVSHKGEPADLEAAIEAAVKANCYITHVGQEISWSDPAVTYTLGSYSWPGKGESAKTTVKVTVRDMLDDSTTSFTVTVTLKDTTQKYTVAYESHGVTLYTDTLWEDTATPTIADPTCQYCNFKGWKAGTDTEVAATVAGNVTYVAQWTPKEGNDADGNGIADQHQTYTITYYDGENGSEYQKYTDVAYGEKTPVPETNPTKENHRFAGWLTRNAEGKLVNASVSTATVKGNAKYYASWIALEVITVTYKLDGVEIAQLPLAGENAVNLEITSFLPAYSVWEGWFKTDTDGTLETSKYDFSEDVTASMTLTGVYYIDRNDNGIADGTDEDRYTYYVFVIDGENREIIECLTGEEAPDPKDYAPLDTNVDGKVFLGWKETVSGDTHTYTAIIKADENNNAVADEEEDDKLVVYVDGYDVSASGQYSNGKLTVGQYATVEVADLIKNSRTFDLAEGDVIEAVAGDGYYVAAIQVDGTAVTLSYDGNYKATYTAGEIAEGSHTVAVYIKTAAFAEGSGSLTLGEDSYTVEDVYKAAVSEPAYNNKVAMSYLAREKTTVTVDMGYIADMLIKEGIPASFVDSLVGYKMDIDLPEKWLDVTADVEMTDAQNAADAFFKAKYEELGIIGLVQLLNSDDATKQLDFLYELKDALEGAELRPFAYNAKSAEAFDEKLSIRYTGDQVAISDKVTLTLTDNRENASITVDNASFTYGKFTDAQLLAKATLVGPEGGELVLDASYADNCVGTYTVTVTFKGDKDYKPCTASFKLTVKQDTPTVSVPYVAVHTGNGYSAKPTITPSYAGNVNVIVGVDLTGLPVVWDSVTDGDTSVMVDDIVVNAWVKVSPFLKAILTDAGITDGFDTLQIVAKKIDAWAGKLEGTATGDDSFSYVSDKLSEILTSVENMVTTKLTMVEGMDYTINVNFADDAYPTARGFYLNFATVLDETNFNWNAMDYEDENRFGFILIYPCGAIPNQGGLQLLHNGRAENVFTHIFDSEAYELNVEYKGKSIEWPVYYYGFTTDLDFYESTTAPTEPGLYVACAVYTENGVQEGSDSAVIIIGLEEATIDVAREIVTYDGQEHAPTVTTIVPENCPDAAVTMITASIEEETNGNIDLSSLSGNLNIDFPDRVDALWEAYAAEYIQSDEITVKTVLGFLEKNMDRVESRLPFETMEELVGKSRVDKVWGYTTAAYEKLIAILEQVPESLSVTFEDDKAFTETGVYLYYGVVTDPYYIPDANAGVLVIKSADTYVMSDTYVPYDGEEHDIAIDDQTARDGIEMIVDEASNSINFRLDGDMEKLLSAALDKAGYTLKDGSNAYVGTIYSKGEKTVDETVELIVDTVVGKISAVAKARINGKFEDESDALIDAMDKLADKMVTLSDKLTTKLSAKLQQLDKLDNDTLLIINGKLPVEIGEYEFYGLDYDVAWTSATLYIEPIHIVVDDEPNSKLIGEEDPDPLTEVTVTYYSYQGVGEAEKVVIETLPANTDPGLSYSVSRTSGDEVGVYDMSVAASITDASGIYVLDEIVQDGEDFEIKAPVVDVTITALVNGEAEATVTVGDEAEVTIQVTDAEGAEITVEGLIDGTYTITDADGNAVADLTTALQTAGTYTITPNYTEVEGYNATVVPATLVVEDEDVVVGTIAKGKWTMSLDSVIYLNYFPAFEGFSENFDFANDGGVVIWVGAAKPSSGNLLTVGAENCITIDGMTKYSEDGELEEYRGQWYVQTHEIFAKNIGDMVYIRPYVKDADGEYVYAEKAQGYSPARFCYDKLKNLNDRLDDRKVCVALLEYGAQAQKYFNYNTNNLVTNIPVSANSAWSVIDLDSYNLTYSDSYLDATVKPDNIVDLSNSLTGTRAGIKYVKSVMNLEGAIRMTVSYNLDESVIDLDKVKSAQVLFWTQDAMFNADTLAYEAGTYTYKTELTKATAAEKSLGLGDYTATSDHILAKNLGETVYYSCRIEVYTDDNKTDTVVYRTGVGIYSPEAFLSDHLKDNANENDVDTLCKKIAVYGEMARIRFIVNKVS